MHGSAFDPETIRAQADELEGRAGRPGFWDDPNDARAALRLLSSNQDTLSAWHRIQTRRQAMEELAALDEDGSLEDDLRAEVQELRSELFQLEDRLRNAGPHDEAPAILTVRAGEGGADCQEWAQTLAGMYSAWAEAEGRPLETMNVSHADSPGVRNTTFQVGGEQAYRLLEQEQGRHRLVRMSPFSPDRLRHTSVASVEVIPAVTGELQQLRSEDLRLDTFHASGPGGQNVAKVASAVRLTHIPTGTVASCQTERSQYQNRQYAFRLMKAKLQARADEQMSKELARLRDRGGSPSARRVRSYVLHPKPQVTDHRTGLHLTDAQGVLAGNIRPFIEAALQHAKDGRVQERR